MSPVPPALARALAARQDELGCGPRARAAALALADGATVVATGQQPGLLGGPLLCLHKAAGALALARASEARGGRRAVAVFWVASEDHDWGECSRATVLDASGGPRDLALPALGGLRSVRDVPVPRADAEALLAALEAALPATERAREALEAARPPPGAATDLGTWFGAVLARVLGDSGLVLVEPHVLAPWAGDALAVLAERAEDLREAVAREGEARRARGLAAPLEPSRGEAPLFVRETPGGARLRVGVAGDTVTWRGEPAPVSRRGLAAMLRERPDLGSGDVVGRVLVQDALLPVTHLVAGPAEAAYLAQVAPAHAVLGLAAPEVVARPSATWAPARVLEDLSVLGVDPMDAAEGRSRPPAPAGTDDPASRVLGDLRARAQALAQEARRAWEAEGAGGEPPALERALASVDRDLVRALDAHRAWREARQGLGRARYERALAVLRPKGQPQERVLCALSLVARHGVAAVRAGLAGLAPGGPHRILPLR